MKLSYCDSDAERLDWCRQALLSGLTLSDPGMWVAGVDNPSALIRKLRKEDLRIKTVYVRTVDAAGGGGETEPDSWAHR